MEIQIVNPDVQVNEQGDAQPVVAAPNIIALVDLPAVPAVIAPVQHMVPVVPLAQVIIEAHCEDFGKSLMDKDASKYIDAPRANLLAAQLYFGPEMRVGAPRINMLARQANLHVPRD